MATYGSGKPVIALGSDIDGIPQSSQKPGVAYHDPIIEGAPGHGEGHNTGMPLNIIAAIAVKKIMERDKLPGTIMLWPGVAEELVASKAWFVRDGMFKDVDVNLFTHVGGNLGVGWGQQGGTGLVSMEFTFEGETAHSAGAPWRGRSALDAVELMSVGWQYRREHLRLSQRSHSVITNGGDQPNVVPRNAIDLVLLPRDRSAAHQGAGRDRQQDGRGRGADDQHQDDLAHPRHRVSAPHEQGRSPRRCTRTSRPSACRRGASRIRRWPRGCRRSSATRTQNGLAVKLGELGKPVALEDNNGGGSDDIGDISWNMPTITLSYPANIPGLPGHNWSSGIASATPIAHKGVVAGAKAQAMTVLDLLTKPELVKGAWDYFNNVQTKDVKYIPFITKDTPAADALEQGDPREVSRADAEVLLRPDEVPDLPGSVGDQVPDGSPAVRKTRRTQRRPRLVPGTNRESSSAVDGTQRPASPAQPVRFLPAHRFSI